MKLKFIFGLVALLCDLIIILYLALIDKEDPC